MMFYSGVIVVAPHGAGLSNVFFSQPGTYVVEGVCNLPHVNLCFQWLTHILGQHWHGVTSRRGCESVVDVSPTSVEDAVRSYLRLWMLERSSWCVYSSHWQRSHELVTSFTLGYSSADYSAQCLSSFLWCVWDQIYVVATKFCFVKLKENQCCLFAGRAYRYFLTDYISS